MCKRDQGTELVALYVLLGRISRTETLRKAFLEHIKVCSFVLRPPARILC